MLNKKIKNAKEITYDNKVFDSKLELYCYKLLQAYKIDFYYNEIKYTLLKDFRLNKVHFIHSGPSKKTEWFKEEKLKDDKKIKLSPITYTPDFVIKTNNNFIIIETKGFQNDVYPYKRKLLFNIWEKNTNYDLYFFEPRNQKQVRITIEMIYNLILQ